MPALSPSPVAWGAPVWLSSRQVLSQLVSGDSKDETSSPLPCTPACPMLSLSQITYRICLGVTTAEITAIRTRIPHLMACPVENVQSTTAFQTVCSVYHLFFNQCALQN